MSATDGGPAFPHDFIGHMSTGMSLRDWFAGQALIGLLARGAQSSIVNDTAEHAFMLADAMLAARSQALVEGEGR